MRKLPPSQQVAPFEKLSTFIVFWGFRGLSGPPRAIGGQGSLFTVIPRRRSDIYFFNVIHVVSEATRPSKGTKRGPRGFPKPPKRRNPFLVSVDFLSTSCRLLGRFWVIFSTKRRSRFYVEAYHPCYSCRVWHCPLFLAGCGTLLLAECGIASIFGLQAVALHLFVACRVWRGSLFDVVEAQ